MTRKERESESRSGKRREEVNVEEVKGYPLTFFQSAKFQGLWFSFCRCIS